MRTTPVRRAVDASHAIIEPMSPIELEIGLSALSGHRYGIKLSPHSQGILFPLGHEGCDIGFGHVLEREIRSLHGKVQRSLIFDAQIRQMNSDEF